MSTASWCIRGPVSDSLSIPSMVWKPALSSGMRTRQCTWKRRRAVPFPIEMAPAAQNAVLPLPLQRRQLTQDAAENRFRHRGRKVYRQPGGHLGQGSRRTANETLDYRFEIHAQRIAPGRLIPVPALDFGHPVMAIAGA